MIFVRLGGEEKDILLRRYQAALAKAAQEFGCMGPQIEAAVAQDFGVWVKQEKLPKLPPPAVHP
jgi:hypothetical protein